MYKTLRILLASRASSQGFRYLNVFDSSGSKGAAAKGRSSSVRLNRILWQSLPYVVGCGLQFSHCFTLLRTIQLTT